MILWIYSLSLILSSLTAFVNAERSCENGHPTKPYPPTIKNTTLLLQNLREKMKENGVDGYLIVSADEHQTEYVAPWFKRQAFISGFTGSSGTALVTLDKAAVWTDGRYHDQLEMQVDCNWILQKQGLSGIPSLSEWMRKELSGKVLGIDPKIISIDYKADYIKLLGDGITWKSVEKNLVDEVWVDRPDVTYDPIKVQPVKYSGRDYQDKIKSLRGKLTSNGAEAIVVQELDDVAWLLNIRGNDVPYTPFVYAYVIVTQKSISLFVDQRKITADVRKHFRPENASDDNYVTTHDYSKIGEALKEMTNKTEKKIWITPETSVYVASFIPEKQRLLLFSPIQLPKARKNAIEIEGMKTANIRDGVAIMDYFVWLEEQIKTGNRVTEISGAEQLTKFKGEQENFQGLSFSTISGFGPHGAIIHYRADNITDAAITDQSLYLLDNGAQFPEGSTDITRTIHLGTPTEKQKERFTMVLQGVIGLASVIFPSGTYGSNIDAYAREYLWKVGLDYRHGTGHGIGHYLSIHEGPGRINQGRPLESETPIYAGMIFSDEPGYYEAGEFGIRLETAICVVPVNTTYKMKGKSFYGFEVITWVPFDKKLINIEMLDQKQIDWLNKYNKDTRDIMGPVLLKQSKKKTYNYMMKHTEPISQGKTKSDSTRRSYKASGTIILFLTTLVLK